MNPERILAIDAGHYAALGVTLLIAVGLWIVGGILRNRIDRRARRLLTERDDRARHARSATFVIPPPTGLPPCYGDHDLVDSDEGWVVCQTVGCGYAHRAQS